MHKIGFPGLGIKDFDLDPIAFSIFGLDIAWYGIIITLGIACAIIYAYFRGKQEKMVLDDLLDIAFAAVIPGIIGARIYYVFFDYLKNPQKYKSFFDIINIRGGGLAIYGGLIFGIIGCIVMLRIKHMRILKFLDCIAPGVMLAQAMGRWGNFFNAEAYGAETSLPWRMRITFPWGAVTEVHPTFLYESLWNLVGFIVINTLLYKRKKFDGQIFAIYVSYYGLGRMFIEGLRQDSLYAGSIRISQIFALFCLVAGLAWLIYCTVARRDLSPANCIYYEGSLKYNNVMNIEREDSDAQAYPEQTPDWQSHIGTNQDQNVNPSSDKSEIQNDNTDVKRSESTEEAPSDIETLSKEEEKTNEQDN